MLNQQLIPFSNIFAMATSLLVSVVIPFLIMVVLLVKRKFSPKPIITGVGIFLVCFFIAIVTGQIAAAYISNIGVLVAVLSLRAGLVEETGRLVAFKFFLKKNDRIKDAWSYGFGHGFCEAALLVGMSYVSYIATAVMFNSGALAPIIEANPAAAGAYEQLLSVLRDTPAVTFFMAGLERLSAMTFHMAASLLVFYAVRTGKYGFYGLAILLHTAFNCLTIPLALGLLDLVFTEVLLALAAIAIIIFAIKLVRKLKQSEIEPDGPVNYGEQNEQYRQDIREFFEQD